MSNLIVADADTRPRLLDFGVARVLVGSKPPGDPRDDIAALGTVARELLADRSPLRRGLEATLARAAHANPANRPSAAALATALRRHAGFTTGPRALRIGKWLALATLILTAFLLFLRWVARA
jgi:hypothetical protein